MEARELQIKENWKPVASATDEELKKIAKDLYNGLIFTDSQCRESDIHSVFMCLLFMGPKAPTKPKYPNEKISVENNRDNALYDVLQRDADQAKYEEDMIWYEKEIEYYHKNFLSSIGLIYEYLSEAGPMSVNGKPTFFSLKYLNKEDTEKMIDYYYQYKEIREKADNF